MKQNVNYVNHHRQVNLKMSEDPNISPYHISVYNALFQIWNECHFDTDLSINRNDVMKLSKIGNANTYTRVLKELDKYGYIKYYPSFNPLIGSKVTIIRYDKGSDKGTGKGSVKSSSKGTDKGGDTLYKQVNNENNKTIKQSFETFWNLYDKKVDRKKTFDKWKRLKESERDEIIKKTPEYVKHHSEIKYRKNPVTFLNNRSWEDEIKTESQTIEDNQFVYVNGVKKLRVC